MNRREYRRAYFTHFGGAMGRPRWRADAAAHGSHGAPESARNNVARTLRILEGEMGRPRVYESAAAKHRAYRARLAAEMVRVNRKAWAALEARTDRLADAVWAAQRSGCLDAQQIRSHSRDGVLDELAASFEARAKALRAAAEEAPTPGRSEARARRSRKEGSAPDK